MDPKGTIIFSTVGRLHYGFDIFSIDLTNPTVETRLTDSVSINYNAQFAQDDEDTVVFVSERTGSPQIFLSRPEEPPQPLPSAPGSLFHDRPILRDDQLLFISAHEEPDEPFKSWSALYSTKIVGRDDGEEMKKITRLTPPEVADFSPAVSKSGELIAVASYGSRRWGGEFHELHTQIVIFKASEPETTRTVVTDRGGWPTWSRDETLYFHRVSDDGWWSIYRVDIMAEDDHNILSSSPAIRVTPSGLHAFTPAAFHDGRRIAVATRRKSKDHRHVEIFDLESRQFTPVTEPLDPDLHHYNPFVSTNSTRLGYHRFRGESPTARIPPLNPVQSPVQGLDLLRIHGSFPSVSPDGSLIAFNSDSITSGGLFLMKSDGSKQWTLISGLTAFHTSWSKSHDDVIYTSLGPIFSDVNSSVQIARVQFDLNTLETSSGDLEVKVTVLTREGTGNNAFPSASPDGIHVVFRSGRTGHKNLFIMDSNHGEFDQGHIRQLTDGPWIDTMPCWSPAGDLIAFSSNRGEPDEGLYSVYVVRPDGTGLRRVHVGGGEGERVNHVGFGMGGEWVVFAGNLGGLTSEPVSGPNQFQPYGDLWVSKVEGKEARRVTWGSYENGTPTWWDGDGRIGEIGRLGLEEGVGVGEVLKGGFDDPLWIKCEF